MKKLGIIGCGNMGSAVAEGLVKKHVMNASDILVFDKMPEKTGGAIRDIGCAEVNLDQLLEKADSLLLAIKPQDFAALREEMQGKVSGKTIISIMAGVKINKISGAFGGEVSVARAMPNMNARFSKSMTAVAFGPGVKNKPFIKKLFQCIGKVVVVDEEFFDIVTALSGSGPAYLFHFVKSMMDAGIKSGLSEEVARKLVVETLYGTAVTLMKEEHLNPHELAKKVTSKGGTTEAALKIFEESNFSVIVEEAVLAAKKRSRELSEE
ncbi:MAG: pyrroline-5-carboxylate reductase [Candidatus Omnitrophica bacterium]|nr:pyrroline-5-carboxylate reductase [Candidatus Omnitrophota bacterium]